MIRETKMELYWQETRKGQRLVLGSEPGGSEEEVGGVRITKRGFDAFAKTFGYDPGRAEKGIESMEEAKAFVESFHPWDLFTDDKGLLVEPDVRPMSNS